MTAAFIFRLKYFRANAKYYLLKGEQLFDEASDELVKTTEVMFATQRDDEKKNWSISI